jgi:hypothetical protein
MFNTHPKFALAGLVALALPPHALAADFFVHDGDRVVFLGDSITEQRLYTTYVEAYTLTRHPAWKLSFRKVGWGGDTSWLRQRSHPDENKLFAADDAEQKAMVEDSVRRGLDRDVLPLHPTTVTVKFGMNDHYYQPFQPDIFQGLPITVFLRLQHRLPHCPCRKVLVRSNSGRQAGSRGVNLSVAALCPSGLNQRGRLCGSGASAG